MQKNMLKAIILGLLLSCPAMNVYAGENYEHGIQLYNVGAYEDALYYFETCVKDYENIGDAYKNIALIKYATGDIEEALIALDKSLLKQPDPETYMLQASYFEEIHSYRAAIRVVNKAIDIEPTNPEFYETRARLKKALGQNDNAMFDNYLANEIRRGNTDIIATNSHRRMRSYSFETPVSNKTSKSSQKINMKKR